jgi:hypothetical protein
MGVPEDVWNEPVMPSGWHWKGGGENVNDINAPHFTVLLNAMLTGDQVRRIYVNLLTRA